MTSYRNKYLEMLKTDFGKKPLPEEPSKTAEINFGVPEEPSKNAKINFGVFAGSQDRPVSDFSPPYDAEGVPCGLCPTCHRGEFWRYPKFHQDHDPRGWVCWFCSPPPHGSGPCDFCGVPEGNK
jgi:hypothetical protein